MLSNLEIARSLRNILRNSLWQQPAGVELLDDFGALPGYPGQPNSEYRGPRPGSQTMSDNIHGQKENNPDRRLRPQNLA